MSHYDICDLYQVKSGWRNLVDALWRRPIATLNKSANSLRRWFDSPLGEVLLKQQQPLIQSLVEEYTAETQLIVSPSGAPLLGESVAKNSVASHRLQIDLSPGLRSLQTNKSSPYSVLVADLDAIPLMDNSVGFVLLHHSLEFSRNPHQVLREVTRVLAPGGSLVIVGFNRWSLLGLRRWISQLAGVTAPWAHHPLSSGRLIDWMYLMSCEPMGVARGFYGLPIQCRRGMAPFAKLDNFLMGLAAPCGGFYMLHATKLLFGRSQQRKTFDRAADLIRLPVPSSAARFEGKGRPNLSIVNKADRSNS